MAESEYVIIAEHISKQFRIKSSSNKLKSNKIVLNDISFNIAAGEIVGLIGRNGSGKSTLLKIISKIIKPSAGSITIGGKVASILELSMGFHRDMSGRENIYLMGELYGFSKKDIDSRLDSIIQYSSLGISIDDPIRTYSSGMIGRLAFSIITQVDADIYLIDEVLSVGDISFSSKASDFFKQKSKCGKTMILVSHNLQILESLCNRGIWVENGDIAADGRASMVISKYKHAISESEDVLHDLSNAGYPESQYKYAKLCLSKKDESRARFWLEKSANQGYASAQMEYANLLYHEGNTELSLKYYMVAAEKGNEVASKKMNLLLCTESDRTILNEMRSILKERADKIGPSAEYRYADFLLKISLDSKDERESFEWFLKSADGGNVNAAFKVATMYRDGLGVERNISLALEYFTKAADCGHIFATYTLGEIYSKGQLVPRDYSLAYKYYLQGAKLGNGLCQLRVANQLLKGDGVEKNIPESEKWRFKYILSTVNYQCTQIYTQNKSSIFEDYLKYLLISVDLGDISSLRAILVYCSTNPHYLDLGNYAYTELKKHAYMNNLTAMRIYADLSLNVDFPWYDRQSSLEILLRASEYGDVWCMSKYCEVVLTADGASSEEISNAIKYGELAVMESYLDSAQHLIEYYVQHDPHKLDSLLTEILNQANNCSIPAIHKYCKYVIHHLPAEEHYEKMYKLVKIGATLNDEWCKAWHVKFCNKYTNL